MHLGVGVLMRGAGMGIRHDLGLRRLLRPGRDDPGLGRTPGLGRDPGLGSDPGLGRDPGLGSDPGLGRDPGILARKLPRIARLLGRARAAALEARAKVAPLGERMGESRLHRL
ncbi:MAG: hypothetical protein FWD42_04805 [Solirubrobacterales bacterium]|nr:hypothetical protein [Solirubrobacterales bacterium]